MWISQYFVLFILYSFLGWGFETIYCTIKGAKWDNRGFLNGPICPIYGAGGVAVTMLADMFAQGWFSFEYTWWQVFLVSFFGATILEYITSWVLEKLFHAYWWDYSKQPLNINGRVCFFCSLSFGIVGILVVYVFAPKIREWTGWISPVGYEVLALVLMAVLFADITLTVSALTSIEKTVAMLTENVNSHMDQFVDAIVEKTKPVVKELLAEKREAFSEKSQEESERLAQENVERIFHSMGKVSRGVLARVKGFRRRGKSEEHSFENVLAQLKLRISKKK